EGLPARRSRAGVLGIPEFARRPADLCQIWLRQRQRGRTEIEANRIARVLPLAGHPSRTDCFCYFTVAELFRNSRLSVRGGCGVGVLCNDLSIGFCCRGICASRKASETLAGAGRSLLGANVRIVVRYAGFGAARDLGLRLAGPLLGASGHGCRVAKCPLLTQSGTGCSIDTPSS